MRKELTDEWQRSGIHEPKDFAILTNVLTKAWSGMTTGEYKRFKGLTKQNLRGNLIQRPWKRANVLPRKVATLLAVPARRWSGVWVTP